MRRFFKALRSASEAIGHAGNMWTVLALLGWQAKAQIVGVGLLGSAMTFLVAAAEGFSPLGVWILSLAAGALICVIAFYGSLIWLTWRRPRMGDTLGSSQPQQSADSPGPVYWSLAETLSWIAFGKAITSEQWKQDYVSRTPGAPDLEKPAFEAAERLLFEKLRADALHAYGKKDKSETYETVPSLYFLSDVSCWILHDAIDASANLGTILAGGIPKYKGVRFKRGEVLKEWPKGGDGKAIAEANAGNSKIDLMSAAKRAYSETEGSMYAVMIEAQAAKSEGYQFAVLWGYANAIVKWSTVWGCKPPSENTKPQDLKGYWLASHNDGFIARANSGPSVINNLMVSKTDLASFIDRAKRFPNEGI